MRIRNSLRVGLISFLLLSNAHGSVYAPRGVGGGGALAGYSISPYSDLRFVGTDMGTLFRSSDRGKTWLPIDQRQIGYNSDLSLAADIGFSSSPKVVFFADAGKDPKRSRDGGLTWAGISITLHPEERIRYWLGNPMDPENILCATTEGLFFTNDQGNKWTRFEGVKGNAKGTVMSGKGADFKIFHATANVVFLKTGSDSPFKKWFSPVGTQIRAFTGGSDDRGITLALIDTTGKEACMWSKNTATFRECGWVWVHQGKTTKPLFRKTRKEGGRFLRMAQNDSRAIYVTGGDWERQKGSKIWISRDAGVTWTLQLNILDWDAHPYRPWPKEKLEYSAVGMDAGWNDNAPFSFSVNLNNSAEAGVTGHYFLHITLDHGKHWRAPFTEFADTGERAPQKKWKSTGLEVTSALRLKFYPGNPKLGYVSVADLGGYVTEDGGTTWRISKAKYNTNYDYAFDPGKPDFVFSASGDQHDFPSNNNSVVKSEGGIFSSKDRGRHWMRLTPDSGPMNRQFLSVAYDSIQSVLYGGTQGGGIVRSRDGGKKWDFFNNGLPEGDRIIPQLEVDSKSGAIYALLSGNAPEFSNSAQTGIYRLDPTPGSSWTLLRKSVGRPAGVDPKHKLWLYPSAFAIDFTRPKRDVLWLVDMENQGAWLATGIWKSTDSGTSWVRKSQFTHPTAIKIDPHNPEKVYVSGSYDVSGKWGIGGALSTKDGGKAWSKNERLPLLANLFSFTPDPNQTENGFYLFFGGGIFYGPKDP